MTLPGPVSWIVLAPVIGVLAILFVPKERTQWIKMIGLAAVGVSLAFALFVAVSYDPAKAGYQFVDKYAWIPQLDISFHVGVDGINSVLLLLTALCSFAGVYSAQSIQKRVKEYFIFYLLLINGCFGVLSSLNVFFMYFFYECAVVPVFPLIGVWGSGNKEYATMKLTLYLTLGAVLALLAILAIYWVSDLKTFNFVVLEKVLGQNPLPLKFQQWAFPCIMLGFGVILTLWPFHSWSPMGYAAAPTSVSMLHAGVLKKLGAYLIIRLGITLMPAGAEMWMPYVATLAVVNIVYCGLIAFRQKDLKYILGYSSCSHMGFILLGLACMTPTALTGTVYFMFAHGLMAALGFGLVGFIYDQTHTRELADWGGFGKKLPFIGTLFVMMAMASAGVPGFANFVGEMMILFGAWDRYPIHTILAVSGLVISAGYMLMTVRGAIQGALPARWEKLKDATHAQKVPFLILLAFLVAAGVLPSLLLPSIQSATKPVLDRANVIAAVVFSKEVPDVQ